MLRRTYVIVAFAAIALATVTSSSEASPVVRDHRQASVGTQVDAPAKVRDHRHSKVRDHRDGIKPPPSVNRPGQGGVIVTSRPRPKKERACLLGIACTFWKKLAMTDRLRKAP